MVTMGSDMNAMRAKVQSDLATVRGDTGVQPTIVEA